MHVVRVLVRALVVVADQHLRAVCPDQFADPARDLGQRDVAERARVVLVLPLGHAGVTVAEGLQVGDAEDLDRLPKLGEAQLRHLLRVMAVLAGLDAAGGITELAVGTGDDDRSDALVGVGGEDATAGCLVVRVGVNCHEGKRLCHTPSVHYARGWL